MSQGLDNLLAGREEESNDSSEEGGSVSPSKPLSDEDGELVMPCLRKLIQAMSVDAKGLWTKDATRNRSTIDLGRRSRRSAPLKEGTHE